MDVFDLYAKISIDTSGFESGIANAKKTFKSFSDNISSASSGISKALTVATGGFKAVESVGKTAMDGVTKAMKGFTVAATAVAGFGTAAVKTGMEFDATMSQVSAISGATGDDFQALRDKALEMGAKTKFSASEAAEAMNYMAMAGWKTQDMLNGIAGIMNLAAASGEDLASTSDIVTDALTAFGMSASESGHFADILAAASSNANTNVGMMGDTFKYVAPIAGAMGYTAEDTAVAIGLMANSGIKASQAGTALRSIITRMAKPTKESATAMEALGVSITDSNGEMLSLSEIMVDLRAGFSNLTEDQKASYAAMLGGQEAMSGLLAIANASEEDFNKLTQSIADCSDAYGGMGAAAGMAATMVDNLQGDLTLLGSAFESLQIAISDSLTPTLREFAQFGQKAMANLLEGFQGNGVTGFMSALSGIVTDGVTMLAEKAPEFTSVSLQFVEALANGLLGAKDQILSAFNQSADVLISGADSWLFENESSLYDFGMRIIDSIFSAFSSAGDLISEHIGKFVPLIADAFLSFHETLFTVGLNILGSIGRGLVESKDKIKEMASSTISNMVTALTENAPSIFEGGIALIEALVGSLLENASLIAESAVEIVTQLATSIGASAPDLIPAAVEAILKFIEGLTSPDSIKNLQDGAFGLINGLIDGIANSIPLLIEYVPEIIANLVSAFIQSIPKLIEVGVHLVEGLLSGLGQGILAIPEAIAKVAGAVIEGFKALFGIHSPSTVFAEMGGFLVQGLINGISDAWNGLKNFVGGLVDGLVSGVKSLLGIHSPSTVFAKIGGNMALGLGEGWEDEYADIRREIENGLSFSAGNIGVTATGTYSSAGSAQNAPQAGFGGGNTYVTINSPVSVDAVQAAREWKKTTQRMAMSYA